jgi:putative tryptophan/tyrosine transport system substrate-binding protein
MRANIGRREFVATFGGLAAAWPLAAGAEQRKNTQEKKIYRIGFLFGGTIALRPQAQEFWRKLQELGYIEGKNIVAEIREAHGDIDRLSKLASELVETHPDVIVAVTPPAVAATKVATQTIPIVMAIVSSPVELGFVESLARPRVEYYWPLAYSQRDCSQESTIDQRDDSRAIGSGHTMERKEPDQCFAGSVG